VLGVEYQQEEYSLTDEYFAKMGLQVRYFMPRAVSRRSRSTSAATCSRTTRPAADRHDQHDGDVPEDLPSRDLQRQLRSPAVYRPTPRRAGLLAHRSTTTVRSAASPSPRAASPGALHRAAPRRARELAGANTAQNTVPVA
jgi:hypothetical protein